MESHLGPSEGGGNITNGAQADAQHAGGDASLGRTPHGSVVHASQVAQHVGGSRGNLEGAPAAPNQRMHTEVGLPAEAANWKGSGTHYGSQELPPNDWLGSGFAGSTAVVSAAELDEADAAHGTSVKPLKPGAYQLRDGNILLVYPDGQRGVVSPQQYQQMMAQAQQQQAQAPQQPAGLVSRMVNALRQG